MTLRFAQRPGAMRQKKEIKPKKAKNMAARGVEKPICAIHAQRSSPCSQRLPGVDGRCDWWRSHDMRPTCFGDRPTMNNVRLQAGPRLVQVCGFAPRQKTTQPLPMCRGTKVLHTQMQRQSRVGLNSQETTLAYFSTGR